MLIPMNELRLLWGVRPNGVLHVGAHEGEEHQVYHDNNCGSVIWVEMMPLKAAELAEKYRDDPSVTVINAACWDVDGEKLRVFEANNGQSTSLLEPEHHLEAHPEVSFSKGIAISTSRLDKILPSDAAFDFLNIDIQGAELRALRGLGARLNQLRWIYTEVNVRPLYAGCALLSELDDFMRSSGFARVAVRLAGDSGWGDALYVDRGKLSAAQSLRLAVVSMLWHAREFALTTKRWLARIAASSK
jgi:FkbM family methyltransferase